MSPYDKDPDQALLADLHFRKPRVFIVDDEVAVTELLEGYLETANAYDIRCYTDAFEGLKAIASERPEVALVDLKMPGMHGMQLVSDAQKVSPSTAFVVISGFTTIDTLLDAIRRGVHDYLTKPFSSAEAVRLVVRNAVKQHGLEHQVLIYSRLATSLLKLGEINSVGEARPSFFEMVREVFCRLMEAECCVSVFRQDGELVCHGHTTVPLGAGVSESLVEKALRSMGSSEPQAAIPTDIRVVAPLDDDRVVGDFGSILTLAIPSTQGIEAQLVLAHSRPAAYSQEQVKSAQALGHNVGIIVQRHILGASGEQQMIMDILHHIKDGVVVLDRNYRVRYVNGHARRILALGDEAPMEQALKAIARVDETLVTPGRKGNFMAALQKQVAAMVGEEERFFDVEAYAFNTPNKVAYRMVLFRDITHIRKEKQKIERLNRRLNVLNDQLRERNRRLESLVKELDSFAYIASHDLQEPFRHIEIFAQFLERDLSGIGDLPEEVLYHIDQIEQNVDVARRLLGDLRTLSRITRMANPHREVELLELVEEVLERFSPDVQRRGARVTVHDLPSAYGDPIKLKEVLHNLIGNALKYAKSGVPPVIDIWAEGEASLVTVTVADQGIGVDPQYHDYIFQPCRRIPHGEEVRGSGLGLAIVRKIIDEHGGQVWVESRLGEGAAFRFTLPRQEAR
jgi:signal transduction histidine kinase/FixJ family two-component response regulator